MNNLPLKKKVQVVVIAKDELLLMEFNTIIPNNYLGFQNITGAVEEGESFEEAAMRELIEEAGFDGQVLDLNLTYEFRDRWENQCFEKVFLCNLTHRPEVRLSEEHKSYRWIPLEEVTAKNFRFPSNYDAFLQAKHFLKAKAC